MTAWQYAIRSSGIIKAPDKRWVNSTLQVLCLSTRDRLFLTNYVSIIALQTWRYLLRVANSGLKGDGFIYLTVELVQRVFGDHKILPARQCNGLLFHLLADFLYFYICFGRRWQLNRLPSSGDVNIKLLFAIQIGLYWLLPPLSIGAETAEGKIYPFIIINTARRQILTRKSKKSENFFDAIFPDNSS